MGRWLAPLLGVVGLGMLVVGLVWAEVDKSSMAGVGLAGYGIGVLVLATGLAAAVEALTRRPAPHR